MSTGTDRFDVKAAAGWSRVRADGTDYDRETDHMSAECERWAAAQYDALIDEQARLRGDVGYDFVVLRRGHIVKVDAIHAGRVGELARPGHDACVIVNPDSNKLLESEVIVFVEGLPGSFAFVGAIYTSRFLACARYHDHGYGLKLSLPARALLPVEAVLPRRPRP